jgi:DNA-directed RNA polymerase subunit RPC12/RpoP
MPIATATNKVPLAGTLRRCVHGLYAPTWTNGCNAYCALCNPSRVIPNEQSVILPRSSADKLSSEGRTLANKRGNGCPACGSSVWMRSKENGGDANRVCADCGIAYKIRLSVHRKAQQVFAEIEAESCLV